MLSIETKTGFSCEVDERIFNDYEFLEVLCMAEDEPAYAMKMGGCLLGKPGMDALKAHVKELNEGFCDARQVFALLSEIMTQVKPGKN